MSFSSKVIALNNKTSGKDKIYRTVQYGCKLIWYILWKYKNNKDYVEILKKIESTMSSTRKVLRLAKSHEMVESALSSIHIKDPFLRYTLTLCYINQACYLVMDNLVWLHSVGAIDMKKKLKSINEWSNKFWLYSSILYLARDMRDLLILYEKESRTKKIQKYNESDVYPKIPINNMQLDKSTFEKVKTIIADKNNRPLILDSIKNTFDIFLPLSSLEFVNISPGTQGFCGLISSVISLIILWNPDYKLSP